MALQPGEEIGEEMHDEKDQPSEPMWTLFFKLHTGPVVPATIRGLTHDRQRHHAEKKSEENPCKTGASTQAPGLPVSSLYEGKSGGHR